MDTSSIMGMDDFLKMFLAQLQNQNPMSPMEGNDFTNQLAMFSTVEQLKEANTKFDNLISIQTQTQSAIAVSYIGKEITYAGNAMTVEDGKDSYTIDYALKGKASDVKIMIKDDAGKVVRTLEPGSQDGGENTIPWDGKDDDGKAVKAGRYSFSVSATDLDGNSVASQPYITGQITGVYTQDGETLLQVNGSAVSLSDIVRVTEHE